MKSSEASFQTAWLHSASLPPNCSDDHEALPYLSPNISDWNLATVSQAAILGLPPYPVPDAFPSPALICYSVNDRSPAPLSEDPGAGSSSTSSLSYHSSASSVAVHQVSKLIALEPQSQSDSLLNDVSNPAVILDVELSRPLNLPSDSTSTTCPPPSNSGHSQLLASDAALPVPLGVKPVNIPARSKRCTRCWTLRKKVCLLSFRLIDKSDKLTLLQCARGNSGTEDFRCLECIRFDIPAFICS